MSPDVRYEVEAAIDRWLDAYPKDVFPPLTEPATQNETLRAVMLARHILDNLAVEVEGIFLEALAKERGEHE